MTRTILTSLLALGLLVGASSAGAQEARTAHAQLRAPDGTRVGEVTLRETPAYGVLLDIRFSDLAPGVHAFHIHETGQCEAPSFTSAGGHYAPRGNAHGALRVEGKHAGDLLNLQVPPSGGIQTQRLAQHVTLLEDAHNTLFDADGSAIVVHQGADDYQSQPSGDAGSRVACGVIERR